MQFYSDHEQRIYDETLRFGRGISYDVSTAEKSGGFPLQAWRDCAAFGLLAMPGYGDNAPDVTEGSVGNEFDLGKLRTGEDSDEWFRSKGALPDFQDFPSAHSLLQPQVDCREYSSIDR